MSRQVEEDCLDFFSHALPQWEPYEGSNGGIGMRRSQEPDYAAILSIGPTDEEMICGG